VKGATLGIKGQATHKIQRAGITSVRYSQFAKEVVRVVLDLEAAREYRVVKGEDDIRVSFESAATFEPWTTYAKGQGPVRPVITNVSVTEKPASKESTQP